MAQENDFGYPGVSIHDLKKAADPENWIESQHLHTHTLDAHLDQGALTLTGDGFYEEFSKEDTEALTRFLSQYSTPKPLLPE